LPSLARSGTGLGLSVSDEFVVYRGEQDIQVERIDGAKEGSFQVSRRSTCDEQAMILGEIGCS
jgi:hypothetical protein